MKKPAWIKGLVWAKVTARGHRPGALGPRTNVGERWARCLNGCGAGLSLADDGRHYGGMLKNTRCRPKPVSP